MAAEKNIGILIASTLRPTFVDDVFPIVLSKDIRGGIHTITASTNFNEINVNRRDWGMLAFVYDEQKFYQLLPQNAGTPDLEDDANWVLFSSGSEGSLEWVDSVKGIYNDDGAISPSPVDGDRYLVGQSGAGNFNGYSNQVAVFAQYLNSFSGGYLYTTPPNGCTLRIDNEPGVLYTFVGTSSSTGTWYKELQNTVRYIYPTSNNGLTFSYTTTTGQTPLMGYTYCVFFASFATSNSGTVSLSIDGNFYAPIKKVSSNALTDLSSGDFGANVEYQLTYDNGVFQILLPTSGQGGTIGPAEDNDYTDGLFTDFTSSTPIGTPIDRFNEILKALVPPPAPDLNSWSVTPQTQFVTGKLSYGHSQEPFLGIVSASFSDNLDATQGDSYIKGTYSGYRLGINSLYLQTSTTEYYQDITGILNSGVSVHPSLPSPAYATYSFGNGITGSVALYLNSVTISSVNLASTYNAIDTTNSGATSGLSLTVATNSKFTNGNPFDFFWYRTGTYRIKRDNNNLNSGYNKITIKHLLPASTITLTSYEFISDASTTQTTFGSPNFISNLNVTNTKYLSGIRYYTSGNFGYQVVASNIYRNTYYEGLDAGSFADVSTSDNSNIYNGQSYPTNISNSDAFSPTPVTQALTTPASVNQTFQFSTSFAIQPNRRKINGTSTVNVTSKRTVQGTVTGGTLTKTGWYIDTVVDSSTALIENFNGENRSNSNSWGRLTNSTFNTVSSITSDNWDSSNSLLSTYTNALQVADGRLLYPSRNFQADGDSTVNPNWGVTNRNYTTCRSNVSSPIHGSVGPTGDNWRTYTRVFDLGSTSYAKFSVVITFQNTTFVPLTTALSGNSACYVEFKLPHSVGTPTGGLIGGAVTGWLDACKAYDGTILPNDEEGCLEGNVPTSSGSSWKINFGGRNTYYSGGKVLMRITAGKDWNGYIQNITIVPG